MPTSSTDSKSRSALSTGAAYTVRARDIAQVLCHRKIQGVEEFLVRWRTKPLLPVPPGAPCSWHSLDELWDALHYVQTYLESRPRGRGWSGMATLSSEFELPVNRKRKSPDSGLSLTPDTRGNGSLSGRSLSPSIPAIDSDTDYADEDGKHGPRIYNAVLQKKAGTLLAKVTHPQLRDVEVARINAKDLPTPAMIEVASKTPVIQAQRAIRRRFLEMLQQAKGVSLENNVDSTTPSLNFTFIPDYVYGEGVVRPTADSFEGCDKCRPDMGQGIGCEYTQKCGCLEYAAVDEQRLAKYPELHQQYLAAQKKGSFPPEGLPKRFPYSAPSKDDPKRPQKLVSYYLDRRYPIYECNQNCRCGPRCKSRLVQKGRRVALTIFKTPNRGWGIKCNEPLVTGEFIDTYVGEVITNEEATRREQEAGPEKDSYLYALNKFVDSEIVGDVGVNDDNCYVVDGQYKGGITRFINHSCEPNCRQFTVHYDKNNFMLYTLAFFAFEDIPAGTELTFDYQDLDEEEEADAMRKREEAMSDPANRGKTQCNCGSKKCRGFLWVKKPDES